MFVRAVFAERAEYSVGELGRVLPSVEAETSNVLQGAVKTLEDVSELAKAASKKASSALEMLHEAIFPEKEVPKELEELASVFDAEGGCLEDFVREHTVRGLKSALVVLLGNDPSGDFDQMVSSVPAVTAAHVDRASDLARKLQEALEKHAQARGSSSS